MKMKKLSKIIIVACIGILSMPAFTAEPDDQIDYFDVRAEGYVYDGETNKPITDASVRVEAHFKNHGLLTQHSIYEYYNTDHNGYFNVRFVRRFDHENVTGGTVSVSVDKPINNYNAVGFSYNELRKLKKLFS